MSMKRTSLIAAGITLGAFTLSGCATQDKQLQQHATERPANVPAALSVGAGKTLTAVAKANGVQIYKCGADKNNPAGFAWNLKAPEADLFNADGKLVGKHYGGPTWEGTDGSKVVGQVKASDKGSDPNAIAWLLLNVISNSGEGRFAKTTTIQRLNTAGGKAPPDGCDAAHFGSETRVPYTGQYYFYD